MRNLAPHDLLDNLSEGLLINKKIKLKKCASFLVALEGIEPSP